MKKFRVSLQREALDDLDHLYDWIVDNQGSVQIANRYTTKLRDFVLGLANFPHRGTRRDDLREGLRIIGFERRVSIAFTVDNDTVHIARIFYGGRDVDALLENENAAPIAEGGDDSDN